MVDDVVGHTGKELVQQYAKPPDRFTGAWQIVPCSMRTNLPKPIGELLGGVVSRLGIKGKLDEARMIEAWADLAGPQILAVTDSVWVRRGRLFVKLTSATWRQELHLQRSQWMRRINEHLGAELVKELVFR